MKACPQCFRLYSAGADYCQADGSALRPALEVERPSDPADPRLGRRLDGKYRLFRVVADGGMARVYEAIDERDDRHVAVKILHPECARDGIAVERFRREFEIGSHLSHPNIVDVFDFKPTDDGSYMLIMEFLVGEELRALLRRERRVTPARLVRMLSQLALGMDFAHAGKWVHRDLKPDNLFLCQTPDGDTVKILDFGSVKDKSVGAKQLTVMGTTIGSPFYMSPEQAQGLPTLDHRTDVWAAAAISYEAVTGSVPFNGPNGPSILLQILSEQPRPPTLHEGVGALPDAFDEAILRGLAKTPEQRPSTVGEFADGVGRALGLDGDHASWAGTTERELEQRLGVAASRMPPPSERAEASVSEQSGVVTTRQLAVSAPAPRWGLVFALVVSALVGALLVLGLW